MSTENPAVDNSAGLAAPSQPVAPPSQAGGTPESTPAPVDTTASEAQPEADEAKKRQSRSESRAFATIRRENRELYRRLGAMEERLASSQQPPAEGEQPTPRVQVDRAAHDENAEAAESVLDRLEEAGQDIDGFDEVLKTLTNPQLMSVSRTMRDFLGESDHPAQLAQWLTKNRDEAKRISRLEPAVAVRALEKVEAKLAAAPKPAPKKVTGAPPPVSTVGGGSNASFDANKAGMDDFAAWRRRQKA